MVCFDRKPLPCYFSMEVQCCTVFKKNPSEAPKWSQTKHADLYIVMINDLPMDTQLGLTGIQTLFRRIYSAEPVRNECGMSAERVRNECGTKAEPVGTSAEVKWSYGHIC